MWGGGCAIILDVPDDGGCSSAGERLFGVEEVEGSIPSSSTISQSHISFVRVHPLRRRVREATPWGLPENVRAAGPGGHIQNEDSWHQQLP
jgi:hypothetical protein